MIAIGLAKFTAVHGPPALNGTFQAFFINLARSLGLWLELTNIIPLNDTLTAMNLSVRRRTGGPFTAQLANGSFSEMLWPPKT